MSWLSYQTVLFFLWQFSRSYLISYINSFNFATHKEDNKNPSGLKNPYRGPIGITRLAEWWQTVIMRDRFFYPTLTRIVDSFSHSPLNTILYWKNMNCKTSRKTWIRWDGTWWHNFNITMTSRIYVQPACAQHAAVRFLSFPRAGTGMWDK